MSQISNENKTIAKTAAGVFGGQPKVIGFWDADDKNSVDLLICEGRPQKGVNSYSTIGLSDAPIFEDGREVGVRVEFVGACASSCEEFENILTTAAFCIINSQWFCSPGTIFPDIVSMYECSSTMQHLMFVPPFLWDEELKSLEFDSKTVAWLMAVPISDAEYRYAVSEGPDKLEDLFEQNQIDIFNINRPSVV
ncbi:suppressor of fused domain protein [Pelagibius sp. Alg239-R121]|uniref:suppressor of fused domain protein n=1 Tax=Pelagibius sp. Alg239-R121 TaxID=2993448 RepID=UPI0024A6C878|nr:suppressor of fused domain protein [Pelagibius sp. Alg239-R121]